MLPPADLPDPGNEPGSPALQADSLPPELSLWVRSNMCAWVLSRVQLFAALRTVARQSPLSRGFSRQEYWSGLPFLTLGDLPRTEPASLVYPGGT